MEIQFFLVVAVMAVALFIILLWRTADGCYGKVRPNRKVAEAYECFCVEDHLAYYLSGSDHYPNAMIGIEKTWLLDSDLWKPRDLTPQSMRELVRNMRDKSAIHGLPLFGFDLLDHHGEKIGNCYSVMDAVTTIKITGKKTVIIHTPPLDTDRDS